MYFPVVHLEEFANNSQNLVRIFGVQPEFYLDIPNRIQYFYVLATRLPYERELVYVRL